MSLSEPTSKMSKSAKAERSRILITDDAKDIQLKINSALTDSLGKITYDPAIRPGVSNLLDILSIFDERNRTSAQLAEDYSDLDVKQLKRMVTDAVILGLDGIRDRYVGYLSSNQGYLEKVEAEGARKARKNAAETMVKVREAIGLSLPFDE